MQQLFLNLCTTLCVMQARRRRPAASCRWAARRRATSAPTRSPATPARATSAGPAQANAAERPSWLATNLVSYITALMPMQPCHVAMPTLAAAPWLVQGSIRGFGCGGTACVCDMLACMVLRGVQSGDNSCVVMMWLLWPCFALISRAVREVAEDWRNPRQGSLGFWEVRARAVNGSQKRFLTRILCLHVLRG